MKINEFLPSSEILILDDVLTIPEIITVQKSFLSPNFPWFFPDTSRFNKEKNNFDFYTSSPEYIESETNENTVDGLQLCHVHVLNQSVTSGNISLEHIQFLVNKICKKLNVSMEIFRIKSNCQFKQTYKHNAHNYSHRDYIYQDHLVMIYYVNDSDGNTKIFKEDSRYDILSEIEPKAGRFVIFNGNHNHAGSHPKLNDYRIVVNFNISNVYLPSEQPK